MKYINLIAIALTAVLCTACTEDEPYVVGVIDPIISVETTATTAEITINLTKSIDLFQHQDSYFCTLYLNGGGKAEFTVKRGGQMMLTPGGTVTFKNLTPGTTYSYYLQLTSPTCDYWNDIIYESDKFTFTTASN